MNSANTSDCPATSQSSNLYQETISRRIATLKLLLLPAVFLRTLDVVGRFLRQYKSLIALTEKGLRKIASPKPSAVIGAAFLAIYGSIMILRVGYGLNEYDDYCYASLAKTISQLKVTEPVKELAEFGLSQDYIDLFIPVFKFRGPKPGTMSNVSSIGLPLQAAAAAAVFGWDIGPFLIAPLSATLSVLLIYLVGLELGRSRKLAVAGAVLLAVFPITVLLGLTLATDAPALLWSLAAVFAALRARKNPRWAPAAGFAFSVSVLIRPPNALLLFLPILFALPTSIKSLIRFGLGGLPAAALFFFYNWAAYGSPFKEGHADLGVYSLFQFAQFTTRFPEFIYWVSVLMSPTAVILWAAMAANKSVQWRDRALIVSWFAGYLLFYSFYDTGMVPYSYWSYTFTRYLLPGMPAVILGFLLTIRYISNLFTDTTIDGGKMAVNKFVATLLLLSVLVTSVSQILRYDMYYSGVRPEEITKAIRWAGDIMPQKSLVASSAYCGLIKYHINRPSIRYDVGTPEQWSVVKTRVKEKGYQLYALLHPEELIRARPKIPGKWTLIDTIYGHTTLWRIDPE